MGVDDGNLGSLKKSMYGTPDAASNLERDRQEHLKSVGWQLGLSSKNLFRHEEHRVSGVTRGDDFVATRPTLRLADLKNTIAGGVPNQNKSHKLWVQKKSS